MKVDQHLFDVAAKFIETAGLRYYLGGVFVEPCHAGGVTLTATDGHKLISIRDHSGSIGAAGIFAPPLNRHIRIDGTFPDWKATVRKALTEERGVAAAWRSDLIQSFVEAGRSLSGRVETPICILPRGAMTAALIRWPDISYAFGVVMPIRADIENDAPDWAAPPPPLPASPVTTAAFGW